MYIAVGSYTPIIAGRFVRGNGSKRRRSFFDRAPIHRRGKPLSLPSGLGSNELYEQCFAFEDYF
jgi:hypothetical protein